MKARATPNAIKLELLGDHNLLTPKGLNPKAQGRASASWVTCRTEVLP